MDFETIKCGWLFRQSSILKRWKKCWFVLYRDGYFKYFDNPNQHVAEAVISICLECSDVLSEVRDVSPPTHLSKECLLSVVNMDGDAWIMCAESEDDKKAWEISLNDARLMQPILPPPPYSQMTAPPPYCANPQQLVPCNNNGYPYAYQYPGGQTTTIVYADQPHYYRRDGSDLAMGMMTGAALGSLMWGPLLWW